MMRPVRWGVLGASNFAREKMAPAIHQAAGAELCALATSDPAKAEGFRAFCPSLRVHAGYEALLADAEVEAVYIPLPNHLHVEWALKAVAAGKHVLCEKPFAMRAGDFDALIAARDGSGLLVAEAFMIVQHPQWIRARELVDQGAIGRVRHLDAAFCYNNPDPANIRNKPEAGGGGLRDIGVYTFGAARFVTGAEPERLAANVILENGVDTFAEVTGVMAGPGGRFTYRSMTSTRLPNRQEVVVQGEAGLIKLTTPFNANVFGEARLELHLPSARGAGIPVTTERWPGVNHYVIQVERFSQVVRQGGAYPCPLEFSRGTQAMMDRVFEVAREVSL
ncbi:MAG: Gfo/Idh/MocA family oxidoreductase [Paracoccaceae bacterium]